MTSYPHKPTGIELGEGPCPRCGTRAWRRTRAPTTPRHLPPSQPLHGETLVCLGCYYADGKPFAIELLGFAGVIEGMRRAALLSKETSPEAVVLHLRSVSESWTDEALHLHSLLDSPVWTKLGWILDEIEATFRPDYKMSAVVLPWVDECRRKAASLQELALAAECDNVVDLGGARKVALTCARCECRIVSGTPYAEVTLPDGSTVPVHTDCMLA